MGNGEKLKRGNAEKRRTEIRPKAELRSRNGECGIANGEWGKAETRNRLVAGRKKKQDFGFNNQNQDSKKK
jgi:hypothetical protein